MVGGGGSDTATKRESPKQTLGDPSDRYFGDGQCQDGTVSVFRAVDPGVSGLSVEMKVWGKPHGSWDYQYDVAKDEGCWLITWHHNFIDADTRAKTAIFKKLKTLPKLQLWYYAGGSNREYCSVLMMVEPPVIVAADSSAAAGSSAVWSDAVS